MSKKVSLSSIKEVVNNGAAMDLTSWKNDDLYKLEKDERGFNTILYSVGTYGCSGALVKGFTSGRLYGVTSRTNALFIVL